MPENILISGSRVCTTEMRAKVHELVAWAKKHGHRIIVGDALGTDAAVRLACAELGVKAEVWGAYDKIRGPNYPGNEAYQTVAGNYLERDKMMASLCDRCFGLKHADSPTHGTEATYHYAKRLDKPAKLRVFAAD